MEMRFESDQQGNSMRRPDDMKMSAGTGQDTYYNVKKFAMRSIAMDKIKCKISFLS